jgi:hypothetical protein
MWDMDPMTDRATPHQIEQSVNRWRRIPGSRTADSMDTVSTAVNMRLVIKDSIKAAKVLEDEKAADMARVKELEDNVITLKQQLDDKCKELSVAEGSAETLRALHIELPPSGKLSKKKLTQLQKQLADHSELTLQVNITCILFYFSQYMICLVKC